MTDEFQDDFPEEDHDDGFKPPEEDFQAEGNAFQRVGRTALSTYSLKGAKNPYDQFVIMLSVFVEKTFTILKLSTDDRTHIFDFAARAPNIIFKNVACFVLGYIGSGGGREVNDKNLKKAFASIDKIKLTGSFEGIEAADVLRYAVYWATNYNIT